MCEPAAKPSPSKGQAGADPYSIPLDKIDVSDAELFETDTLWGYFERCQEDPVLELDVCWIAGRGLEPEWPIQHGYTMEVEGNPNVRTRVSFSPSRRGAGLEDYRDLSNTITAMPVVVAIPTVHAAAPGIRTYADLPLITARYAPPRSAGSAR